MLLIYMKRIAFLHAKHLHPKFSTHWKIIIARDLYENYVSNFYDDRRVEFYNLEFENISNNFLVNLNILVLYPSGQVIWTNMLIKNRQKEKTSAKNKSIVTLTETTGQRVLNNIFWCSYFMMFLVYSQ